MQNRFFEQAVELADMGFAIFPLIPNDKKPLISNWQQQATTDLTKITEWNDQVSNANIGIAAGAKSDLIVIDIDGEEGYSSLTKLVSQHGALPVTRKVITGSGGMHIYYKNPLHMDVRNSASKIAPKIDIRGEGGYVVAPHSVHPNGTVYRWDCSADRLIASAPEWLLELISAGGSTSQRHGKLPFLPKNNDWQDLLNDIGDGRRNQTIAQLAGLLLRCGSSGLRPQVALELCHAVNEARCNPPLDEADIETIVRSVANTEYRSLGL